MGRGEKKKKKRAQKAKEAGITRKSDVGKCDSSVFIKINTVQERASLLEHIVEYSKNTHMHTHTGIHHHQEALPHIYTVLSCMKI